MACKQSTTDIRGHRYSYTQLPASRSLKLKYRLLGIVGSGIAALLENVGKDEEAQMAGFGEAMGKLFAGNDPDTLFSLIQEILAPVFRDGERVDIDRDFTGNLNELYEVVFWVLKQEYGDFFAESGRLLSGGIPASPAQDD